MTWLLDGNVLAALVLDGHTFRNAAIAWLASHEETFATCAVTQGTLLRLHMMSAEDKSPAAAWAALARIEAHPRHVFWDDGSGYRHVPHRSLQGPKQVTDAWLAELARKKKGQLATFDRALALLHRDFATLVPVR